MKGMAHKTKTTYKKSHKGGKGYKMAGGAKSSKSTKYVGAMKK